MSWEGSSLSFFLFGAPHLEKDDKSIHVGRRKILALLSYLTLTRQTHQREKLASFFWPEANRSHAFAYLRRCLSLTKELVGDARLQITREFVGWHPEASLWVDVLTFRHYLAAVQSHQHAPCELCPECFSHLVHAADLYQGDFLAGFSLPDTPQFDDWQLWQAEALQKDLLVILEQLSNFHIGQSEPESAIPYTRRQIDLDPLHEPAQQQLIRLYATIGQRIAALRQYERFSHHLEQELGATPSAKTIRLVEAIREGHAGQLMANPSPPRPGSASERIKSPPHRRHNLPSPSKPFVGREQELDQITTWLARPDCRLITITGLGGVGKTRLALQAATRHVDSFADGVYFISLETAVSIADLVDTLAHTLPFVLHSDIPLEAQVFEFLHARQILLVFDNIEQLTAIDDLLTTLLATTSTVKLLVTSRRRLSLREEWLLPLLGMAVPADEFEETTDYPAVRLFLQQARRTQPDFTLSPADTPSLIRICRLVGGLPLGIELAAAWTRLLSCREIADQISESLEGLTIGCDDAPSRHQSLGAVCDHSWRLLSSSERGVLRRLAVFAGSFTLMAARSVAGASLPVLRSLMDQSLLQRGTPEPDQVSSSQANSRFHLHPVVQQYAMAKLNQHPDEREATYERHCHHYVQFLQQREADLRSSKQRHALAEIQVELSNIRAAWDWAVASEDVEAITTGLDGLYLFYSTKGLFSQGVNAFEQAIATVEPDYDEKTGTVREQLVARLLVRQGHLCFRLCHTNEAEAKLQCGLQRLHSMATPPISDVALALHGLGRVDLHQGDPHAAQQKLRKSLSLFRDLGDQLHVAQTLTDLGNVACQVAEYEKARQFDQEALALFREIDNPLGIAICLNNLSHLAETDGDYVQAECWLQESLVTAQTIGSYWMMATALNNLSHLARLQDKTPIATRYLQASLAIRRRYRLPGVTVTQQALEKVM